MTDLSDLKRESGRTAMETKHEVRTRHGWGWEVVGPRFQSAPIETAISAERFADALNRGLTPQQAAEEAGLEFSLADGRYYVKGGK